MEILIQIIINKVWMIKITPNRNFLNTFITTIWILFKMKSRKQLNKVICKMKIILGHQPVRWNHLLRVLVMVTLSFSTIFTRNTLKMLKINLRKVLNHPLVAKWTWINLRKICLIWPVRLILSWVSVNSRIQLSHSVNLEINPVF